MQKYKFFLRLTLLLCLCTQARADKKIYLLADTHVMAPSLLDSSDNLAWQEDLAGQRKMMDLSVPIFDQLIERVIADKPDLLLICGDLTKDGEVDSHEYVTKKLTKVKDAGIRVYVIPGNHDYGVLEEARNYKNNTYKAAECYTRDMFKKAYREFGLGSDSEIHDTSLTYCTELFPGLTLIGYDTGNNAHVTKSAIKWTWQKANEARSKGNQVIAMAHQSLLPHFYGQESFMMYSVLSPNERVRDSLLSAGVKVVLTGHYHISDNTRYVNANGQEIYDICTGSPLSYPCDFRILTFDDDFKQLKITTESIASLDGYEDFPEYAKKRLEKAFNRWAGDWFDSHGIEGFIAEAMTESVTTDFIIHAEGNEPENPATKEEKDFYDDLLVLSALFEEDAKEKIAEISLSMRSMLGDYPDDDDQDNVVDDRELTITMPDLSTGIHTIQKQADTDDRWFTLQGQLLQGKPSQPGIYIHNQRVIFIKP